MFKFISADYYLFDPRIDTHLHLEGWECNLIEFIGFFNLVGPQKHLGIMCMKKVTILKDVLNKLRKNLKVIL